MYNSITRKNIAFFPYCLPRNVACIRRKMPLRKKMILMLIACIIVMIPVALYMKPSGTITDRPDPHYVSR